MQAPLVIVGSGLAGYMFAKAWRALDAETPLVMITQSEGHFYSKPMLSLALGQGKTAEDLITQTATEMAHELNAELLTQTEVLALDTDAKTISLNSGQTITYSRLVLASGSTPKSLQLEGNASDQLISVNQLEDYRAYREQLASVKNVALIGGGLVATEFANDLRQAGHEVTVITDRSGPIALLLPPACRAAMQTAFEAQGVCWITQCFAESMDKADDGFEVGLSNGEVVQADLVLSAVGLDPEVSLAKQAGLAVDHGIVTDAYCQTSDPAIFALGDCAQVVDQVRFYIAPLRVCSQALAKTLSGEPTAVEYPVMPVKIKTPFCPTVVCPPPAGVEGTWEVLGEGMDLEATFRDDEGQLRGFVVMGKKMIRRPALAAECRW